MKPRKQNSGETRRAKAREERTWRVHCVSEDRSPNAIRSLRNVKKQKMWAKAKLGRGRETDTESASRGRSLGTGTFQPDILSSKHLTGEEGGDVKEKKKGLIRKRAGDAPSRLGTGKTQKRTYRRRGKKLR